MLTKAICPCPLRNFGPLRGLQGSPDWMSFGNLLGSLGLQLPGPEFTLNHGPLALVLQPRWIRLNSLVLARSWTWMRWRCLHLAMINVCLSDRGPGKVTGFCDLNSTQANRPAAPVLRTSSHLIFCFEVQLCILSKMLSGCNMC